MAESRCILQTDVEQLVILFDVMKADFFELIQLYCADYLVWGWTNSSDYVLRFVQNELAAPLTEAANKLIAKSEGDEAAVKRKFEFKLQTLLMVVATLHRYAVESKDNKLLVRLNDYEKKYHAQFAVVDSLRGIYSSATNLLKLFFKVDCHEYMRESLYAKQRLTLFATAFDCGGADIQVQMSEAKQEAHSIEVSRGL